MPRLHELLAVDSSLKTQLDKTGGELAATFDKKKHLFAEQIVSFHPSEENGQTEVEKKLDLQTTVQKELQWISPFFVKAVDCAHQINEANTQARADVVLDDGSILFSKVPATTLLELEKFITKLHALVDAVPTLDPAKGFAADDDRGKGIYRARDIQKTRTKKTKRPIVLYEATKEHAAQTQLIDEDVPVGKIIEQEWSGMMTPADKADMLSRVEDVMRAVKKARSRANEVEVDTANLKIGAKLVEVIFGL